MAMIRECELPEHALLRRYLHQGSYADCYVTEIAVPVQQAAYVEAFYTTQVFKLERLLLSWLVGRPSTDAQARELALGRQAAFAAWNVEARAADQLLMSDFRSRTRSWLMSVPLPEDGVTRLFFGSAIVPVLDRRTGRSKMGFTFRALLGFHKLYSRILLGAAVRRLLRSAS